AVDGREVAVRDGGERLGLAAKAGDVARRADGRKRLHRDAAAERKVDGFVDDTRAAFAEPALELEPRGNGLRDGGRVERRAVAGAEVVVGRRDRAAGALGAYGHLVDAVGDFRGDWRIGEVLVARFGDLCVGGLGHAHARLGDLLALDPV